MTCREVTEFLMDYLDGSLTPDVRTAFEGHLAICANCRAYLQQYTMTLEAAHAAFADETDAEVAIPEELTTAILASLARPS
jgi:anti-sigma factor RsiW